MTERLHDLPQADEAASREGSGAAPVVTATGVGVTFTKSGLLTGHRSVQAVMDVSMSIDAGETLGLVGESGSGKSTLGRALLKLVPLSSGGVTVAGEDLAELSGARLRRARMNMQMVFQDPYSSLDPSATIASSIAEPLMVHEGMSRKAARSTVIDLLEVVGLRATHADRYPYEFSGGQRQRVAIARALALNPRFIVCDEPVSALDVSTQNQIINLFEALREEFGVAYLFIAHDLSVVRHISDRVAVMYLGHIVETGPTDRVYNSPAHPYTEALLSAIPDPSPYRTREGRTVLEGDLPDPANPPSGCPLQTRCPHVMDICRREMPPVTEVDGGGHVACHLRGTDAKVPSAS